LTELATSTDIAHNLDAIRERIRLVAAEAGRQPEAIRLIAASKYVSPARVRQALVAGQRCFGESTVQEARTKQALIAEPSSEWHFIGHLQTNKAKYIPGNFSWLHTLDDLKLAHRLAERATRSGTLLNVLLQVNIAADPDKYGLPANAIFRFVEALLAAEITGLRLRGLMTIGRRRASPAERRRDFSGLRELGGACAARFGPERFSELSMGMSDDFEAAIAEGATMVRIGSAIFGPGPPPDA
jgi:pyridoxal phosphate enzyme (YggS family)